MSKKLSLKNDYADTMADHLERDRRYDQFDTRPVDLDTFLYDRAFLNVGIKLGPKQYEVLRHSTQIYRPSELKTLKWPVERYVNELYLQWGKGSGKDLISMLTAGRIAYLLLCLKDPQGYFQMPSFANIDMVNMALNAEQAKFNYYEPMRKMICRARCFKHQVDDKEKTLVFVKNIYAHSGHSDEEAAEGKSLILAVLDEISGFKTRQELTKSALRYRAPKYSYEALIDAMKTSRQSRFDTGKLIAISYPRYKGCPIQQLYTAGQADNKKLKEKSKVFVSFGATWDINPTKKKANFQDEFNKNPNLVKAKYMCEPSQAEDSFIKSIDIIDETFPDVPENSIIHTLSDYPQLRTDAKCKHNYACSAHVDLGLNNCRAGFALTHQYDVRYEKIMNQETGEEEVIELPLIAIDVLTSFQSPPEAEIDFSEIRKFIFALKAAGWPISVISYDQWNSAGERQILEKAKFNVVRRSVDIDRSMYDDLMIMMSERRLTGGYAAYRPYMFSGQMMKVCIVKEELQSLVEIRGKKIDHRPGGSKDEADALAGSIRGAIEFGIWKCGESEEGPGGMKRDAPTRAMDGANEESALIARLKAQNSSANVPSNIIYRGLPVGR